MGSKENTLLQKDETVDRNMHGRGFDPREPEWNPAPEPFKGTGTCYIDFGNDRVGPVDVDFFSGASPTGNYFEPEDAFAGEKLYAGTTRLARWFDLIENK